MSDNGSTEVDNRPFAKEAVQSLTGFDEIAIEQKFPGDFGDTMQGSKSTRALIFVMKRREGLSDHDAFLFAMNMPFGEAMKFFRGSDEVVDEGKAPENDSTETGPSSS